MRRTPSVSQYRRRVLAIGAVPVLGLFIVGGAMFNNRIEDDLERRVPDELTEAGFDVAGATVEFSGQNGTMTCPSALDDPPAVADAALDVWGVNDFELDRSCRTNTSPGASSEADSGTDDATDTTDAAAAEATAEAEQPSDTTEPSDDASATTLTPDFDSLADVITTDPQYSTLARLAAAAGIDGDLADPAFGPATLFAPTNAAFEALSPEQLAALESDPDALRAVLRGHVMTTAVADLTSVGDGADLTDLDGATHAVSNGDSVDDAAVIDGPASATNGVVYPIDAILLPDGLDLAAAVQTQPVSASFDETGITLDGVVGSDAAAESIASAAATLAADGGDVPVTNNLTVDAASGIDDATAERLVSLLTASRPALVNGSVDFDGADLSVSGQYATADDAATVEAAAAAVEAVATIEERPAATADDAATVEDQLNALVADSPILFDPGSATIADSSLGIIDQLAAGVQQYAGVSIEVQGHTDSDGQAATNQQLSQQRAEAVRDALIERGVDAAQLSAVGYGADQPILVDGVEDKDASRRVVFDVTAATE